ncbi:MAG: hypothetical protein QM296_08595 [Bacillota bacterium]|nr:hypothetical protein [Bacillota bacterium]
MYIAVVGADPYKTVQLREDFRIPGTKKKRTKVIRTYGKYDELLANDPDFLEKLRAEARRLTKEKKEAAAAVQISLSADEIRKPEDAAHTLSFGHACLAQLWRQIGLDTFFGNMAPMKNARELAPALYALTLDRICPGVAVRAGHRKQKQFLGVDAKSLDLFDEVLTFLYEHKDAVLDVLERYSGRQIKCKNHEADFYVSSYCFENLRQEALRESGCFKDGKLNEAGVAMGLLIDRKGIPITFELFPGNALDPQTLRSALCRLKEKYQLDRVTIVAERSRVEKDKLIDPEEESHSFAAGYQLESAAQDLAGPALSGKRGSHEASEQSDILWTIKDCFRIQKLELKARPDFIWTDERIQGYFTLCFLALSLLRCMQHLYTAEYGEAISAERIRDCLLEAAVVFVGEYPRALLLPVNISEDYLRLHKVFGMKPLKKAMTFAEFRSATKLDPMRNPEPHIKEHS